jgi:hypothetical protein
MTVEERAEWPEDARKLQNPAVLEECLAQDLPNDPPFELLD